MITFLVTTSPIQSNPSIEMIRSVFRSFNFLKGLEKYAPIEIIVICDGFKVNDNRTKWKSGVISSEQSLRYSKYVQNLDDLLSECLYFEFKLKIVQLSSHHGFAMAVKKAVSELISTEYVIVAQHDYCILQDIDIDSLLGVMNNHRDKINYVKFNSMSTVGYQNTVKQRYFLEVKPVKFDSVSLVPLLFFYDKTHIARRDFYLNTVFGDERWEMKEGHFMEDTFGQYQLGHLKSQGMSVFDQYKTYLYVPQINSVLYDERVIAHLNGRSFRGNNKSSINCQRVSIAVPKLLQQKLSILQTTIKEKLMLCSSVSFQKPVALSLQEYAAEDIPNIRSECILVSSPKIVIEKKEVHPYEVKVHLIFETNICSKACLLLVEYNGKQSICFDFVKSFLLEESFEMKTVFVQVEEQVTTRKTWQRSCRINIFTKDVLLYR